MPEARLTQQQRQLIKQRANGCCEYCLSQVKFSPDPFSIEHIIPRSKGGTSDLGNLAVACQDRLEHYLQSIKILLKQYADSMSKNSEPGVEIELIFDTENNQYLLLDVGWRGRKRVHHCIFHFDIKGDKIWLQENNTDIEVDEDLEEMGISKQEIVVGFHHPSMREYSDFATA